MAMTVDSVARARVWVTAAILIAWLESSVFYQRVLLNDASLPKQTDRSGRSCCGGPRAVSWDWNLVG